MRKIIIILILFFFAQVSFGADPEHHKENRIWWNCPVRNCYRGYDFVVAWKFGKKKKTAYICPKCGCHEYEDKVLARKKAMKKMLPIIIARLKILR